MTTADDGSRTGGRTTVDCETFRRGWIAFVGGGMAAPERREHQGHLDACARCAAWFARETGFDRGVRSRELRTPAPPDLRVRVREALRAQAGEDHRRPPWWRRAWTATAAAVALLAALLAIGPDPAPRPVPGRIVLEGRVVDRDCDRAGLDVDHQRGCRDASHHNVLKLDDGRYVRFAGITRPGDADDALAAPAVRGRRVSVEGRYVPATRTIEVVRLRLR